MPRPKALHRPPDGGRPANFYVRRWSLLEDPYQRYDPTMPITAWRRRVRQCLDKFTMDVNIALSRAGRFPAQ